MKIMFDMGRPASSNGVTAKDNRSHAAVEVDHLAVALEMVNPHDAANKHQNRDNVALVAVRLKKRTQHREPKQLVLSIISDNTIVPVHNLINRTVDEDVNEFLVDTTDSVDEASSLNNCFGKQRKPVFDTTVGDDFVTVARNKNTRHC